MGRIPTIYYCTYESCSASFNRKDRYESHLRSHTGERPFICSYDGCEKCFTNSDYLKRHEDSHDSSFKCTFQNCSEVLKTKDTLKKHIDLIHLKIKKHKVYPCTLCEREFNKHNTLQRHMLRHTGELPFKCSVEDCGKTFDRPSRLKRHMKIHKGYPCKKPDCDKVFEKWSLYTRHVKDCHPPAYKCDGCSKIFSSSYALKLHSRIHNELRPVFDCQVPNCSRYYFFKRNLNHHMKKYHAKRPYTCDKTNCFKSFKTEDDLTNHILNHDKKRKSRRKTKPKKPKPSFAAILAGCIKKESNPKASKTDIGLLEKLDVSTCYNENSASAKELDDVQAIPKLNSSKSYQMSDTEELVVCSGDSVNKSSIEILCGQNSSETSQSDFIEPETEQNLLESNQSIGVKECDSVCSNENYVDSVQYDDNKQSPELNISGYTNIEIISGKNSSEYKMISVPIVNIVDEKYWKENVLLIEKV
ncbi:uncharacterized protein TNCT_488601 [Trichonephila clavata]|uniref:C2H2-type domain-containing protein n=1 Tax=Trichonephila clavata TaxID=2740835 RepID=A0A8X6L7F4_TRICU|nr:uncharacterized protein TNCT_488601 [Trichonephila clavata]